MSIYPLNGVDALIVEVLNLLTKKRFQHARQNRVYMIAAASASAPRYGSNIKCIKNLQTVYFFYKDSSTKAKLAKLRKKELRLEKDILFYHRAK